MRVAEWLTVALSEQLNEPSNEAEIKNLRLPSYLGDTNLGGCPRTLPTWMNKSVPIAEQSGIGQAACLFAVRLFGDSGIYRLEVTI